MPKKSIPALLLMLVLTNPSCAPRKKTQVGAGEKLYLKYNCTGCHGKKGNQPFDLTRAFEKYNREEIEQYIRNPKAFGNERMPVFAEKISRAEYPPLIDYIIALGQQARQ
jgi:mono/diheme cytochrome c family protein